MKSKGLDPFGAYEVMFSHTPELTEIRRIVDQVSETDVSVLITGETGTGKDLLARIIHLKSLRRERAFIKVNCAAMSQTLLESELFGLERGASTGAIRETPGKFELARGGTLFLDGIGGMGLPVQPKILRILQNGELSRLGGTEKLQTDVRVISAASVNLEEKVREGTFRKDLFERLDAIHISIPPLRERKEQLPGLVDHFLSLYGKKKTRFSEKTLKDFERHDWPGNIRELENSIRKIIILNRASRLSAG